MATRQQQSGVPVFIAHQFQQFRLLELPPDIVDLIETSPLQHLSIKSSPPSNSKLAYAVLCTPTASFQLRQVQTSNSLYLLQNHNNHPSSSSSSSSTTRAIAACTTTLELHPQPEDAVSHMNKLVPVYNLVHGQVDLEENHISKTSLFADIPLSDKQCEDAWNYLVAFEIFGSSYRPSAKVLAQTWKSINAAAAAEGIKLDTHFLTNDLINLVTEEGYPAPLAAALTRHLSVADSGSSGINEWSCLDREKVLPFVAMRLLEENEAHPDYLTADFLDAWRDSLPEIWRQDAELSAIQGKYELPSSTTIRLKPNASGLANTKSVPSQTLTSRKWHDKFAKTRKR
ncbi:hypothetical protein DM02DRAFT_612390 [Periconia macrospinosa]|uniref:Sister chromatid cohesion protein Dcc1 n=1 Tax=Periconia macrospinosa TaxID=97972 RepID=A0A2V1DZ27_9PLEO|nr:hypothetical protein DM02DRAFT_612390 [Periconia macrospinosa]